MEPLEYLEIDNYADSTEAPDFVWVLLHGLGASGHDFASLPSEMDFKGKRVKFILPHAPEMRVGINNGMSMPAWYDITGLDFERKFDGETVARSLQLIIDLILNINQKLEKTLAHQSMPIFVGGFSQGGAMAMEVARWFVEERNPEKNIWLVGAVILSSYFLYPDEVRLSISERSSEGAITKLPLFMAHGLGDTVVPYALGKKHSELLGGASFTWKEYEMGHTLDLDEIADITAWMLAVMDKAGAW